MSTINIALEFVTGQKTACEVIFTPQDGYWVNGSFLVLQSPRTVRTKSDGTASIVLLVGNYLVTFVGIGLDDAEGIPVSIPNDNLTYSLVERISAPPVPPVPYPSPFVAGNAAAFGITGLSGGGATNLDGLATVGVGSLLLWVDDVIYDYGLWEKIASTHATDLPNGWMRPLDFNISTNPYVWKRRQ